MKSITITYLSLGCAVLFASAYWFITNPSNATIDERKLIGGNNAKPLPVAVSSPPMTKKEAYEERQIENSRQQAKLDFVKDNQRPQKLAESVTRAMKSPYEKKLEELKAQRTTVPVYDGKPFSVSPQDDQGDALQPLVDVQHSDSNQPIVTKRKREYASRNSSSSSLRRKYKEVEVTTVPISPSSSVEQNVFNTTTILTAERKAENQIPLTINQEPIKAAVFGEQSIKAGGFLKLRLLEKVTIEGDIFERNTFFSGKCSFGQDRLLVIVDKMPTAGGSYKRVELTIHDPDDFQEGLYAPSDQNKEGAVNAATDGVQDIISSVRAPGVNIGVGVAQLFKTAVNGTPKITVPDGHPVIFLTKIL